MMTVRPFLGKEELPFVRQLDNYIWIDRTATWCPFEYASFDVWMQGVNFFLV